MTTRVPQSPSAAPPSTLIARPACTIFVVVVCNLGACAVDHLAGKACDESHPCVRAEYCREGTCTPDAPNPEDAGSFVDDGGEISDAGG